MSRARPTRWSGLPVLLIGFLLILLVMAAMVALALGRVGVLDERTELIQKQNERTQTLHEMRDAVRERFIRLNLIALSDDPFLRHELSVEFGLYASRFMVAQQRLEKDQSRSPREIALFEELAELATEGAPILQSVLDAALADDQALARTRLIEQAMPIQIRVIDHMDRIFEYFERQHSRAIGALDNDLDETYRAIGFLAIVQFLLVTLIAAWVIRRVRSQQRNMRQEIDRRQRSEQALQRAKAELESRVQARTADLNRFKNTLDQTLDCVFMFDAEEMVFFYVNEGALRQVGYSREELLAMHPYDIKPHISEEQFRDLIAPLLSGQQASLTFETEHQHKDGPRTPVEIFLQYMAPRGEPSRFVAIVRDISERKRAERMKDEFISTVSHELRTPLTSISGALGLVTGGALGPLPEQTQQMLEIAYKNSQRLGVLINDLLDMEKLLAGKMRFQLQEQPLYPLLERAVSDNQAYADHHKVSLVLNALDEGIWVDVDADRLQQVLANLLSNGAKFSPEGGAVTVSTERGEGRVRVSVTDRGPGIPEAFRDRIFEKFSQADASDTRQKGGSGLGLAISREIVEHMGGVIGFESVPGNGATFWFELPLVESGHVDPQVFEQMAALSTAPRLLIVEDEPDVAEVLATLLGRSGYRVDVAHTGQQALTALAEADYDAVTLDLMLPDITGLEVIRRLRQQPHTADLPVFVVSAKMEEGKLAINGDFSAIEWLAKPVDEERLLGAIDRWMGGLTTLYRPRVLHVEDDEDLHQVIREMAGERFTFELVRSVREARERVALERFDVVILDLGMPDGSGWSVLPEIRKFQPETRVLILSGIDMTEAEAEKVEGVLLKSRMSARELLDALGSRIDHETPRGET